MKIKLINKAGYHSKIENQNGNYIDIDNRSDTVSYTHLTLPTTPYV